MIIIGAGPGGIYSAWELAMKKTELKIAVFEKGRELEKRKCPINGDTVKNCVGCPSCAIMSGFGGAGAFSDGKYNITNEFGGTLHEYIGKKKAMELMRYVDDINMSHGGEGTGCTQPAIQSLRRFVSRITCICWMLRSDTPGTDVNYIVLEQLFAELKDEWISFQLCCEHVKKKARAMAFILRMRELFLQTVLFSVGRSGSKWMETVCQEMDIPPNPIVWILVSVLNCLPLYFRI